LKAKESDSGAVDSSSRSTPGKSKEEYAAELKSRGQGETKIQKLITRLIYGSLLFAVLCSFLYFGHIPLVGLVLLIQVMLFRELTNVRYKEYKETQIPLFRSLMWAVFGNAMFYTYGENVLYRFDTLKAFKHYHPWLAFSAYVVIFIFFVLSLRQDLYKYQMGQLTWTGLSVALVVMQTRYITSNIFQGLFWFVLPAFLVICNDSCAYFVGMPLKRKIIDRPFLSLSPNKSWEGFIGGGLCTVIAGFFLPMFLRDKWFICPLPSGEAFAQNNFTCTPNRVFEYQQWALPSMVSLMTGKHSISIMPVQGHAVLLAFFASLVAPFGGFFASAIKRAYSIKDFDSLIPGHGGLMDRVDCQLMMGMCTAIHYSAFIKASSVTLEHVMELAGKLTAEDQAALLTNLQKSIGI